MAFAVRRVAPILRIFDEALARKFYVDYLGFTVDWEHRFEPGMPVYMQVSRAGCVLHLSEHHGDCCPGSTVFITVEDIDALHAELAAKSYRKLRPGVEPTFHRSRAMQLSDPFGNRLRFDEPDDPANP